MGRLVELFNCSTILTSMWMAATLALLPIGNAAYAQPPTTKTPSTSAPDNVLKAGVGKTLLLPAAFDEGLINSPRTESVRRQLGVTRSQLIRATELPNPSIFMDNGYFAEFTYRYGVAIPKYSDPGCCDSLSATFRRKKKDRDLPGQAFKQDNGDSTPGPPGIRGWSD